MIRDLIKSVLGLIFTLGMYACIVWVFVSFLKHCAKDTPFNWWSVVFLIVTIIGAYWFAWKMVYVKRKKK